MKRISSIVLGPLAVLLVLGTWLPAAYAGDDTDGLGPVVIEHEGDAEPGWATDPANEVRDNRSQFSKTYQNPDMPVQYRLVTSPVPMHYLDKSGVWQDIDTTFRPTADGFVVTENESRTRVGATVGADYLVELHDGANWLRMGGDFEIVLRTADGTEVPLATRVDGTPGTPQGNHVVFPGALGAELRIVQNPAVTFELVTLDSAPAGLVAGGEVVLRERMSVSAGTTLRVDGIPLKLEAGQVIEGDFLDGVLADGTRVMTALLPVAYERVSAEDPSLRSHIRVDGRIRLTYSGKDVVCEKIFPADWFLAPERVYPVVVDPAVTHSIRSAAAQMYSGYVRYAPAPESGNTHQAVQGEIYHYYSASNNHSRGWMKFDIGTMYRYIQSVDKITVSLHLITSSNVNVSGRQILFALFGQGGTPRDPCEDAYDCAGNAANRQTCGVAVWDATAGENQTAAITVGSACSISECYWSGGKVHSFCLGEGGAATANARLRAIRDSNYGSITYGLHCAGSGCAAGHSSNWSGYTAAEGNRPHLSVDYTVECTADNQCGTSSNQCKVRVCNSGRCEDANRPNGTGCSDGNLCTHTDICTNGNCGGTAYSCDDGKTCTSDACNGNNTCTNTILGGYCLIGGTCYNTNQTNPGNVCQKCDPTWGEAYKTQWAYWQDNRSCNDGNACTHTDTCALGSCAGIGYSCNDNLDCTTDTCLGNGSCTNALQGGWCLIGGVCRANGANNPGNDCEWCQSGTSTSAWTLKVNGAACADDGYSCTTDTCNGAGLCVHTTNAGKCLIGPSGSKTCYSTGDQRPTVPCQECNAALNQADWSNVAAGTRSQACYPCGAGRGIGECRDGIQWCENGAWNACAGMVCPAAELCDHLDNDCDNNIDEDFPTKGDPCDGGDYDACIGGTLTCRANGSGVECVNDGAFAFYDFAEGAGATTATKSGPLGLGGISGAAWNASGWAGHALLFDGLNDYVQVPAHAVSNVAAVSMEAWIKPSTAAGTAWKVIAGLHAGATQTIYMAVNFSSGAGLSVFSTGCGWTYSNQVPTLMEWTHVGFTQDAAGNRKLYINGALVESAALGCALSLGQAPLVIGGLGSVAPEQSPFGGLIDDVIVYGYALTEEQMKARSKQGDHCNGVDDDCDTIVDEGFPLKGFACDGADSDLCLYGTFTCHADGLALECVNEDPADVVEICNGLDDDCDGDLPVIEWDQDSDNFRPCEGDCDDLNNKFYPGAPELCDGFDNDCDTTVPARELDDDGDNKLACARNQLTELFPTEPLQWEDCDDTDADIYKGHPEWCDGKDNDCDGLTDNEDNSVLQTSIVSYSPIGSTAGQVVTLDLYGTNFWNRPVHSLDMGYGITVNSLTWLSTTHMRAEISVKTLDNEDERTRLYVARDIVLTSGLCQARVTNGFDIVSPEEIPTLSEWGIIALTVVLMGFGVAVLRRRQRLLTPAA